MTEARPISSAAPPDPARRRRRWWRWLLALAALPLAGGLAFQALVWWWPYPAGLDRPLTPSALILDRAGQPLAAFVAPNGDWCLPLVSEDISPHLKQAVIAVEDHRFRGHGGIDWWAIAAAGWQNLAHRGVVRGASTITMQVQRLRDPRPRTFATKLVEAVRARQLETVLGKDAILVEYLNRAPFGANLTGAGAASWRWFGLPCRNLSLGQAALLAGLPQNPARLRPDRHGQAARARRDHVLARMLACGFITVAERDQAAAEPLATAMQPLPQEDLAAGLMPVITDLAAGRGGLVATSLDPTAQRAVAMAARATLDQLAGTGATAVAVVVLGNDDGACRALVSLGGPAYLDLTEARRSTGSALKPFIYATAFAANVCTPASRLADDPAAWAGYAPGNYDRDFRGAMTVAEALAQSRNLPALQLLAEVGLARAAGTMEGLGLTGLARAAQRAGLTLAIGGVEASPRDLATAYAGLARGGGRLMTRLATAPPPSDPTPAILPATACWQTLHCLDDAGRTAVVCPEAARLRPAWKTGTSSGHRDAWCAAVTPRFTVVVWLGTMAGKGSPVLVGQETAAPLALSLLATIDPGGPTWPEIASAPPATVRPPASAPPLVIVTPADRTDIVTDPDVPRERQRLALESRGGSAGRRWWFHDGEPIGESASGQPLWWDPPTGRHQLRVADAVGHAATATVTVR